MSIAIGHLSTLSTPTDLPKLSSELLLGHTVAFSLFCHEQNNRARRKSLAAAAKFILSTLCLSGRKLQNTVALFENRLTGMS